MSTRFIDVPALAQLLQRVGLQPFIEGLAAAVEEDFRRWPDFDKTARLASHSPQGVIELMPVAGSARYAFKYVNGHPGNPARGLPTVMAFGALADVDTGMPVLLAELTLTLAAIEEAGARPGDRIEHGALVTPELAEWAARLHLIVVTQPHFLAERQQAYRTDVPADEQPCLYRLAGLQKAGVGLAAGSDAPFGSSDPWAAMAAAVLLRCCCCS